MRTIEETARLLSVTPDAIRYSILSGQLKANYSSGKFRISERALISYLKGQRVAA